MLADPKIEERPFEVLKISAGRSELVMVLSTLCGVKVHFLGRSRICAGEGCPACLVGLPAKYTGYVAVLLRATERLLRVTSGAARFGDENGLWVPGRIVLVEKTRDRRPLGLEGRGDAKSFEARSSLSRVRMLSVVARLHGLPELEYGWSENQAKDVVRHSAQTCLRLALRDARS